MIFFLTNGIYSDRWLVMPAIKISCQGADLLPIAELQQFQGNLKSLSEKEYKKLRSSIERHGFAFPVFVWDDNGVKNIIDGHQRIFVVKKMVEEGWILTDGVLPIVWIEAKDKKEAKEKILLSASQYGKIDISDLYEFIEFEQLDQDALKAVVDIPMINLEYVLGPPDEIPNVDGTGETKDQQDYILIEFPDKEIYEEVRSRLGLKGKVRVIKFPDLVEKWGLVDYSS